MQIYSLIGMPIKELNLVLAVNIPAVQNKKDHEFLDVLHKIENSGKSSIGMHKNVLKIGEFNMLFMWRGNKVFL